MKLTGLVVPPDDKEMFKKIASLALDGDNSDPKQAAQIELYEQGDSETPSKEAVAKLVATLRSRLASLDMGRFSVSHSGGAWAYVTVNASPVRKRAAKKNAAPPKAPATTKKP